MTRDITNSAARMDTSDQYFDCVCRTCMNEVNGSSYDNDVKTQKQWQYIVDEIEECGSMRIVDLISNTIPQIGTQLSDELPKKICFECLQQLLSAYHFQQMCVQSEKHIRELLIKKRTGLNISTMVEPAIEVETETNKEGANPENNFNTDSSIQNLYHTIQQPHRAATKPGVKLEEVQVNSTLHLRSIDKLLEDKNSEGEPSEFIKNEPIEGDQPTIEYSDHDAMHSTICMKKDNELSVEPEELQISMSNLKMRRRSHDGDKPYKCSACSRNFSCKETLLVHRKSHEKFKRQPCDICGKNFYKNDLKTHKLVHNHEKKHKCDFCEKCFVRASYLRSHMLCHSDEKPFKCKYCERAYALKTRLANHLRTHLGDNVHRCELCPLAFPTISELRLHQTMHKDENLETRERNIKALRQEEAKIENQLAMKAPRPKTTHEGIKQYECEICGKRFERKFDLNKHKIIHSEEKPFKCDFCEMRFANIYNQIRHMRLHTGDKPYKCEICGKDLITKYALTRHKLIHNAEKPYKCDFCGMSFIHRHSFRRHIQNHTGEKPFKCKYCEFTFPSKSEEVQHLRTHLGKNVYRCELCPLGFPLASELRLHSIKHKNEDSDTRERNMKALREEEARIEQQLAMTATNDAINNAY
ncbi:zinc finger protein 492-like isoform X3 [Eurosta solidaginis]|uniref:zinc finger protein 492-like isoform X3 n=1 Tax=Eurosta solidaginis TaxID=178769 RepID=UPI0035310987